MSWDDVHAILKKANNPKIARPLISLKAPQLLDAVKEGLSQKYLDLELATLAISEFKQRKSARADTSTAKIKVWLKNIGHEPIPWLTKVRNNLLFLQFKIKPNPNYTNSLYVILRDGYAKKNGRYGLYVGQTSKTPEERFSEHLAGIRSGRGIKKNGIQLLYSLMWPWQKVPGAHREFYEAALHKALEINNTRGPIVSGDAKNQEEWPDDFQKELSKQLT